ncbi:patatin-like phospholipase domain-containing protein 5 [Pteropus alecto]|uniref:patatin-like phospholipase domain-containing protein 5 n=1 Tax=Pteropus alecto TaxID=9402 RepID=UPI0003F0FFEC|nr:patatin-like phospholipase domain-containing protein 5 [Pteropus alecto]
MSNCFQEEGSWSLCFSGAGFLGLYHVGVTQCLRERAPRLLQGAGRFYGSSSGALNAVCLVVGQSADFCCSSVLGLVQKVEQLSLGIFHPAFNPTEYLKRLLQRSLPPDVHIRASQRVGISLTRWPGGDNVIVTEFASRDEVIQALICATYFPFYCGTIPPKFRGQHYFDGGLSNNLPFSDSPNTITVSPFTGTVDICPPNTSASIHELHVCNANFQISTMNLYWGFSCLVCPTLEVTADKCRQGYLDALRFLERRGLTKEPVLWMLVSKEPPAPADETQDAGHDQGQKAGLSLNWAVPNVTVKDVPNFEVLSLELETGLKKACLRDSSPWARFCRSSLGRVLTYHLLPCTLPFQYTYFQTRRLAMWLPDMPDDLWWMQGMLRSLALGVYSRTKDQLLGLVSPLVTSPLQPEAAPPVDLATKP